MLERQVQKSREWVAEKAKLDKLIGENSKKLPPEFRPSPGQYKSIPGKKHILELMEDQDRWAEIPLLPIQWPSRKK